VLKKRTRQQRKGSEMKIDQDQAGERSPKVIWFLRHGDLNAGEE
jgi:hypothetical protein